jgi:hypothetical protein
MIPAFHDPDGLDASATVLETHTYPLPWTIQPDFSSFTLAPTSFAELGVHTLYIKLYDAGGAFS